MVSFAGEGRIPEDQPHLREAWICFEASATSLPLAHSLLVWLATLTSHLTGNSWLNSNVSAYRCFNCRVYRYYCWAARVAWGKNAGLWSTAAHLWRRWGLACCESWKKGQEMSSKRSRSEHGHWNLRYRDKKGDLVSSRKWIKSVDGIGHHHLALETS